jgi:hypothetical protein
MRQRRVTAALLKRCQRTETAVSRAFQWARLGSNQRPLACEASALPLSYAPGRGSQSSRGSPTVWRMPLAAALVALVLALAGCGGDDEGSSPRAGRAAGEGSPAAESPLPRSPAALADRLTNTQRGLDRAVDDWRAHGDPSRGAPPDDVTLYALDQQRVHILLSGRPRLAHSVLARLAGEVATHARASIRARRMLGRLSTPQPLDRFRTGPARPAGELLRYYREAQRRFGVSWQVLAAVNLVESAFGRMRNTSTAGAQGPMQFIPTTWDIYGAGGDIDDAHDAILAAGRLLQANGFARDKGAALWRYNNSWAYVRGVTHHAEVMQRDPRQLGGYLAWQVYYLTRLGSVWLPEGYAHRRPVPVGSYVAAHPERLP